MGMRMPSFEDLVGVGAEAAPAHVGDVAGGREERDQVGRSGTPG